MQLVQPANVDTSDALAVIRAERLRREASPGLPAPRTLKHSEWPPNYAQVRAWRQVQLARFELEPKLLASAKAYYKDHPVQFINHWIDTYDPRKASSGEPVKMPFVMFERQEVMVDFILACIKGEANGLIEKARDMGATVVAIGVSVWLWLFGDASAIGWGSQKKEKVDRLGDPSSVFEKIRMAIRSVPKCFHPAGFSEDNLTYQRCINPETGATIIGEIGDDIGRGGRTLIYFVDEAAHLVRPESTEAALLETTRTRIDISSVSGLGTVFYRKREAGVDWVPGAPVTRKSANVFVMDWSHHPEKSQEWYEERKQRLVNDGLAHVFAREIDRDYAAAVEGIVIPADWVKAAIDAHVKLGIEASGKVTAGLDVADGGLDRNAFSLVHKPIVHLVEEWSERDTGQTTRRAIALCKPYLPVNLQYDAIGVGAGVKSEANRLKDDDMVPKGLTLTPWFASARVLDPFGRVIPDDDNSPKNRDFYFNFKAQAWWNVRRMFEITYRAINEPDFTYDPDDIVSLPSTLALLHKLIKELSQATSSPSTTMKMVINKSPEGTRSPNLADSLVMALFPWRGPPETTTSFAGPILVRTR
jgi:hypothetical protein